MRGTLSSANHGVINLIIGLSIIFVGFILLLERLEAISIGLEQLWPSFIIIIGLAVIARGIGSHE